MNSVVVQSSWSPVFGADPWKQCSEILIAIYEENGTVTLFQESNSRA